MRAVEFLKEASDPRAAPPKPGNPEFEKSKNYFVKVINQAVQQYEKELYTLSMAHPDEHASLVRNSDELNNRIKNIVINTLISKSAGNLLPSDKEKLSAMFNVQGGPPPVEQFTKLVNPERYTQDLIKRAQSLDPRNEKLKDPTFADRVIQNINTLKNARYEPNEIEVQLKKNFPDLYRTKPRMSVRAATNAPPPQEPIEIGGQKIKPDDPLYAQIMKNRKSESVNEASGLNLRNSVDTEKLATLATQLWYANRYTRETNPTLFAKISGQGDDSSYSSSSSFSSDGSTVQRNLKQLVGTDPRDPQFIQALVNKYPNRNSYDKLLHDLKQYLDIVPKQKTT